MNHRSVLLLSLGVVLLPSALAPGEPSPVPRVDVPDLEVGARSIRGKGLASFDSTWRTQDDVLVTERAGVEKVDGAKCYVRRQVWPMSGGLEMHSELVMDPGTLQCLSFQQEIHGLPPGASIGATPTYMRWDYDGAAYTLTLRRDGVEETSEGELPTVMFEGSGLGLVLAALPLEKGYEARLPVAMSLGATGDLTLYRVQARVVGREAFPWKKKDVEAWVVEVDWMDFESGEVTSPGGALASGGAYYVVPDPPKGFPHVARYQNDSVTIEHVVE